MLTALLFDLDGTLTDTDTLHLQAFRKLLYDYDGRELTQEQFNTQVSGRSNGLLFAELFPQADATHRQVLAERKEALFRELSPTLTPMPGLLHLLAHAEQHGIGMCVVTNAPRLNAEHMLGAMGLGERFGHVLVADELARPKPDPLPYLTGLQCLQAQAGQALAFEDSLPGVKAAVDAGIFTVGLATTQPAERLLEAGARLVIEDYDDPRLWDVIGRMQETA
ncbi:HAD-IA family hydrolase [Pseudomonas soli]|jgi:HAD superfamily hydrolase (TIGR01509 family)|uniref:HAD-IA family hydrolase n=1 Tax=Pseudomonas soli TaxID=1306993 RepID=A0A1H9UMD4_9PSED|nr:MULTISPECIES: HAD-IA family hydrolase [Pseudomonas]AUY31793.1 haloacid dehalogenase [Pseudomonas sp. PONIH3]MDT3717209.1 HAD-IA family hydrolase [Pseudomonas soli]MDT3733856.1 HAD-IA family hydrolase [Pseudomonas soli]MEE1883701.1 HAD-IA family hydrolase [Pseudomonas soli]SES10468.1 haloacid dehalogenase superfamily, subfamily IA, variant 3 with third motif having DD or ED [Pseudomonas soli]